MDEAACAQLEWHGSRHRWSGKTQLACAIARLAFDYAGTTVDAATAEQTLRVRDADGLVSFSRDFGGEQDAMERLFLAGLVPLIEIDDEFLEQLAFSFAEIPAERRDDAALVDALWSAAGYDDNRLLEFTTDRGGRIARNYSADAARRFQRFAPTNVDLSPAEKTSLYMSLMRRRSSA